MIAFVAIINTVAFQLGFLGVNLTREAGGGSTWAIRLGGFQVELKAVQDAQHGPMLSQSKTNSTPEESDASKASPVRGSNTSPAQGPVAVKGVESSAPATQSLLQGAGLILVANVSQTVDAMSDSLGNALKGVKYEDWIKSGPRKMASDAHLRRTMPQGIPPVGAPEYHIQCGKFHGGSATTVQPFEDAGRSAWRPTAFSKHAFVTMAAGDGAARMALALIQSLRDVHSCPGIDIVVMLSGGGMGSADCHNGRIQGASKGQCRTERPAHKNYVVSQTYIDAMHALGAQTILIPPVKSSTAVIPGGRHQFWGLAFNKLQVYGLVEYESVLWLDSDVFVNKNLDHLLFYPEFTAAFTQDCCNGNASPRPSGGFWVLQPGKERLRHVLELVDGPDPLVPLNLEQADRNWHYGDMAVMMAMYLKLRKVPKYYKMPESFDARVDQARIKTWYDAAKAPHWKGYGPDLLLAGPDDITVYPSAKEHAGDYDFIVSTESPNLADKLAFDLGVPQVAGRRWHMLNESYDFLAVDCQCLKGRDLGPENIFSIHLSCLPAGLKKPGHFVNFKDQQQFVADKTSGSLQPCLRWWYQRWTDAYSRARGALLGAVDGW